MHLQSLPAHAKIATSSLPMAAVLLQVLTMRGGGYPMANYLHYELDLTPQDTVEVTLDAPANVRRLDEANFLLSSQRKKHRYFGGYAPKRVIEIPAPHAGHWHLVVDLGGFAGTVRAWARVLQEAV